MYTRTHNFFYVISAVLPNEEQYVSFRLCTLCFQRLLKAVKAGTRGRLLRGLVDEDDLTDLKSCGETYATPWRCRAESLYYILRPIIVFRLSLSVWCVQEAIGANSIDHA